MPDGDNFEYIPDAALRDSSNISRFMKKYGIHGYRELVRKANNDIEWYWDAVNSDLGIQWFQKFGRVCDSSNGIPRTRWFVGGKCNIVSNAIDRHARDDPGKVAYIFENEAGEVRKVTYGELDYETSRLAGALASAGIGKGDVVSIYMPMIPEAFFAIFACSKIGAVHATVFSGFSSQALHSRLADSNAKALITCETIRRHSKVIDLQSRWKEAVKGTQVNLIVVAGQAGGAIDGIDDRKVTRYRKFVDGWMGADCETRVMDSEDPLFILYTSGTTGRPKGTIQVHGGFTIVAAQQASYLIDMKPDDILFWYADIGWITGQTWVVYGSPIVGATALIYDGALDYPDTEAWCRLIDRHRVTIFGVAPTAIRLFIKNGVQASKYDFSSLRILATTGEPINKEAWMWYFENVGRRRCPVINLSGGTEAGGAILSALPVMPLKPCTVGCQIPGFDADAFDDNGNSVSEGYLVIKKPWPSMSRGMLNDPDRFIETYWSRYKDVWYHGDIVLVDSDGQWFMRGRVDDVIKVSGHRIGTAEIEAAITMHPAVAEAAVVGRPDEITGEAIVACIVLKDEYSPGNDKKSAELKIEIASTVEKAIGKFACLGEVRFVNELPKTRTGKLVRRLIREKVAGSLESDSQSAKQDLSSIENPGALEGF